MKITQNFNLTEFHSKDGVSVPNHLLHNVIILALALEVIRAELGNRPLAINSAFRSRSHNNKVGGAKNSFHLKAMAVDISSGHRTPRQVFLTIERLMNENRIPWGAVILYPTFVHYDIRGTKIFKP